MLVHPPSLNYEIFDELASVSVRESSPGGYGLHATSGLCNNNQANGGSLTTRSTLWVPSIIGRSTEPCSIIPMRNSMALSSRDL
jgi:hypothetical protein